MELKDISIKTEKGNISKVFLDGEDISRQLHSVTYTHIAGNVPTVTLQFFCNNADIEVSALVKGTEPVPISEEERPLDNMCCGTAKAREDEKHNE